MEDNLINLKNSIKLSFSEVKKHILELELKINENKEHISKQKEIIELLLSKINELLAEKQEIKPNIEDLKHSSIGKKGVSYSFIHSFKHSLNTQKPIITGFNKELEQLFYNLTKQEFLVFLTIYQLEEDLKREVTYLDISRRLNLSPGCIRTYVSNILNKKLPLKKLKINNKIVILTVDKDFRSLNLSEKLLKLYYQTDPEQTKLSLL